MAYKLIAAIVTILQLDALIPSNVYIRHFIDNAPAKQCVVAGHSRQQDLNEIVGLLWHTASHRVLSYFAEWVPSEANLADAPSRNDCQLLKQLGGQEIKLDFARFSKAAEQWRSKIRRSPLVAR